MASDNWEHQAVCRRYPDPELWFPVSYESADGRLQTEAAREICGFCPVRAACLVAALEREGHKKPEYRNGVWGGMTPNQRYNMARNRPLEIVTSTILAAA